MASPLKVVTSKPAAFVIERDISIPPITGSPGSPISPLTRALLDLMAGPIGASLFVPAGTFSGAHAHGILGMYANRWGGKGWASVRRVEGGQRIWKVAEPTKRRKA